MFARWHQQGALAWHDAGGDGGAAAAPAAPAPAAAAAPAEDGDDDDDEPLAEAAASAAADDDDDGDEDRSFLCCESMRAGCHPACILVLGHDGPHEFPDAKRRRGRPRRFDPTARARIGGDFGSVPHPAFDGPHPYDGAGPLLPPLLFETDDGELPRNDRAPSRARSFARPSPAPRRRGGEPSTRRWRRRGWWRRRWRGGGVSPPPTPGWGVLTAAEQAPSLWRSRAPRSEATSSWGRQKRRPCHRGQPLMGLDNDGPCPSRRRGCCGGSGSLMRRRRRRRARRGGDRGGRGGGGGCGGGGDDDGGRGGGGRRRRRRRRRRRLRRRGGGAPKLRDRPRGRDPRARRERRRAAGAAAPRGARDVRAQS